MFTIHYYVMKFHLTLFLHVKYNNPSTVQQCGASEINALNNMRSTIIGMPLRTERGPQTQAGLRCLSLQNQWHATQQTTNSGMDGLEEPPFPMPRKPNLRQHL